MPVDKDGKLIHKRLTAEAFLKFRISQLKRTIEKGKRPACPSPNEKADALPSTTLAPLKQMTISTSSPVDTAASSFPESPLNLPAPGPAIAAHNLPAAARRSGCSATSSFLTSYFFVDVPHASKAIPGLLLCSLGYRGLSICRPPIPPTATHCKQAMKGTTQRR